MGILTIKSPNELKTVEFQNGDSLSNVLRHAGIVIQHPCGGRGICKKCTVDIEGNISNPSSEELEIGKRLACKVILLGDAELSLQKEDDFLQIETETINNSCHSPTSGGGNGIAVDIGTTTLALKLFNLNNGEELGTKSAANPQICISADVMGRISASLSGQDKLLKQIIQDELYRLVKEICLDANVDVSSIEYYVVTGNTTMLYLLTGRNVESLSKAPFRADYLFGDTTTLFGRKCYIPKCISSFVGADISCAILSSKITERNDTAILCDIGTNGEIALWHNNKLLVTSTAAGPAFEGIGISCGCSSILGAIDKIWLEDDTVRYHTIGDVTAVGICGSGILDAISVLLQLKIIDDTGAIQEDSIRITDNLSISRKDIRAVQLAKAAIAAGIKTLMDQANVTPEEITRLYIAGGFGRHLNISNVIKIGLIDKCFKDKTTVIGNAALSGAIELLLNSENIDCCDNIAKNAIVINLGGNRNFNENFMNQMMFVDNV